MGKPKCFIIMPITTPKELADKYGDPDHFIHVMECLFFPAIKEAGYEPCSPVAKGSDLIHEGIIKHLEEDEMVLCDMTTLNANVFFEFGIRTALNKPICLIRDETLGRLPFDTALINTHSYSSDLRDWIVKKEIPRIAQHITDTAESGASNALWKIFGLQTQAKRTDIESTPAEAKMELLLSKIDALGEKITPSIVPNRGALWETDDEKLVRRFISLTDPPLEDFAESVTAINIQLEDVNSKWLGAYNFHVEVRGQKILLVDCSSTTVPANIHDVVSDICESNFRGNITYLYEIGNP